MTKTYICIPAVEQQHRGSRLHAFMHLSQQFDEKMSVCASFCHKKNHSLLAVIFFWTVFCGNLLKDTYAHYYAYLLC
jgi:hypothetical protein